MKPAQLLSNHFTLTSSSARSFLTPICNFPWLDTYRDN